jgi:tetratricopeptide (TPR) repeat protein
MSGKLFVFLAVFLLTISVVQFTYSEDSKAPAELKSGDMETAAALYQSGLAKMWARKDIDGAVADLKKAVEMDASIIPESPESGADFDPSAAHYFLGAGYAMDGNRDKAIEHFQKSEAAMPGFMLGVHSTERWFEPLEDFDKHLRDGLEKLTAEGSDSAILSNQLGIIYNRLKEYKKAISQFEKSIEIDPRDPAAYMMLAHTYRREREVVTDEIYDSLGLVKERVWAVIGPFDNENYAGIETVYPPENEIKLQEKYEGKEKDNPVQWRMNISDAVNDRYLNFLDVISPDQYVVAYILCYIESPDEREAQIRLGADDLAKMWLNDEEVSVPDVGGGASIDQSIVTVKLKEGNNKILLKIPQGYGGWGLYFRVTDTDGMAFDDIKYLSPEYVLGDE